MYALQLQFLLTFFTPFYVTLTCYIREPSYFASSDQGFAHKTPLWLPTVLTFVQASLFLLLIFFRAINEVNPKSSSENEWRLQIYKLLSHSIFEFCPAVVLLTSVVCVGRAEPESAQTSLKPLFVFLITNSLLWLVVYFAQFRTIFAE